MRFTCIGTGFFIHTGGILATAAHVIRDVLDEVIPDANLVIVQFIPPNGILLRNVVRATVHTKADVAIASVETHRHKDTGEPLRNKVLTLATRVPPSGSHVATWAFPNSKTEVDENEGKISISAKLYEGRVQREYRDGRDSVLLPGPCFETDLGLEGGASGGPVFDEAGGVFGINSTGFDGSDVAYVSHVQSLGGLPVGQILTSDGELREALTIHNLIERGEIPVEP